MANHKPLALWITNPGKWDFWYGLAGGDGKMMPWPFTTPDEAAEAVAGLRNLMPNGVFDVRLHPGEVNWTEQVHAAMMERVGVTSSN